MTRPLLPKTARAYSLHKHGNLPEDYEDAVAMRPDKGRFAIADGASESAFAGGWARLVVRAFTEGKCPTSARAMQRQLQPWRQEWLKLVGAQPLAWYAEAKFQIGAFATVLAFCLEERHPFFFWTRKQWRGIAIGDCCLFQERSDEIISRFPIDTAAAFTDSPALLGSRGDAPHVPRHNLMRGEAHDGDRFWAMTDALAAWFLAALESGSKPWATLAEICAPERSDDDFSDWVNALRRSGDLKNDDVTLLVVQL